MCNAWNHPPDCDCGWGGQGWSGGYGWPSSSGWHTAAPSLPRATYIPRTLSWYNYGRQDVCFPTTCPECGQNVYFVRHNDGCVWLDSLGWPWPKHRHCNDEQHNLSRLFAQLRVRQSVVEPPPMLGRILKRIHRSLDLLYVVATEGGHLALFCAPPTLAPLLDGIIFIRFTEDGLLLADSTHPHIHVKDAHLDPAVLESFLKEPSLDILVGWQPPADPPRPRRRPKR